MVDLTDAQKRKLQRLINASVNAHNAAIDRQNSINAFCEELWGFAPGDRDVDRIIDGCLGGCGLSEGMGVEEFITDMNEAGE